MIETLLALIAGVSFSISGICQIIRMWRTQSSRDVSLIFIILLLVGVLCVTGLTYMGNNSIAYIAERTVNTLLTIAIVITTIYYRWKAKKRNESTCIGQMDDSVAKRTTNL